MVLFVLPLPLNTPYDHDDIEYTAIAKYTNNRIIANCFFLTINRCNSSFPCSSSLTSRLDLLKKSAVANNTTKARHSIARIPMLSSIVEIAEASMSESLLRISRTTSNVIISNCFPIALENDSGIVLINSYTS